MEYCDENIYYTKKRKKKSKKFLKIFVFILILSVILLYYKFFITDNVIKIVKDRVFAYSTDSVNDAVLYSLTEKINYDDLITVEKNDSGDIVLISSNSYKINSINREISKNTTKYLSERIKNGIDIPVLSFLGLKIFSGYGSNIKYRSLNISNVICEFKNVFRSVGINQTIHSIYLNVHCGTNIEIPLNHEYVENITEVLLCENVLVGKVPDIYLRDNLLK